jgi:hypothetical protein
MIHVKADQAKRIEGFGRLTSSVPIPVVGPPFLRAGERSTVSSGTTITRCTKICGEE